MKYQVETVQECLIDMADLHEMHYAEISTHKELKKLKPDYDAYLELELNGNLRVMTVREDNNMIGYCVTFIQPHIHYIDCTYALNDILFIHPDHRGGTVGYRLIKEAIRDLKENTDANILCIHMKVKYPFRNLLAKFGFQLTEENWEVEL